MDVLTYDRISKSINKIQDFMFARKDQVSGCSSYLLFNFIRYIKLVQANLTECLLNRFSCLKEEPLKFLWPQNLSTTNQGN